MLSKIDYGLDIYGKCAKTNLKIITAPYHAAVRRTCRAFPTTPTMLTLAESGLPQIPIRVKEKTMKLIPRVLLSGNHALQMLTIAVVRQKHKNKMMSTLKRCLVLSEEIGLHNSLNIPQRLLFPPWNIQSTSFILNLKRFNKDRTPAEVYKKLFVECTNSNYFHDWDQIFTDGSKSINGCSFAVTNKIGEIISVGLLPEYCSIFTTEMFALHKAILHCYESEGSFIICTDSYSAIEAVRNPNNCSIHVRRIRDLLINQSSRIKIMWIPSHVGIIGNEAADSIAKNGFKYPVFCFIPMEGKDCLRSIRQQVRKITLDDWNEFQHSYKKYNPECVRQVYPLECSKESIRPHNLFPSTLSYWERYATVLILRTRHTFNQPFNK